MKHFYQDIEGRFDFEDVYTAAVREAPSGVCFLEIGCWQGRSTAFLATEILNSGKDIHLHVVDTFSWLNDGQFKDSQHLKQTFLQNIEPVKRVVTLHDHDSSTSFNICHRPDKLWFIYVDGNHAYKQVRQDIKAWYPRLMPGGYIAGHDYGKKYAGLRRAVSEAFGFNYQHILNSWIHRKPSKGVPANS